MNTKKYHQLKPTICHWREQICTRHHPWLELCIIKCSKASGSPACSLGPSQAYQKSICFMLGKKVQTEKSQGLASVFYPKWVPVSSTIPWSMKAAPPAESHFLLHQVDKNHNTHQGRLCGTGIGAEMNTQRVPSSPHSHFGELSYIPKCKAETL